jgi:hypothetical protein
VASRAEAIAAPGPAAAAPAERSGAPSLGGALRAALSDLYFHSWRLVPANVVWSVVMVVVLAASILAPVGLAFLAVLGIPTAGLFRMSARIARGQAVSFWDSIAAWRVGVGSTLLVGGVLALVAVVLTVNLVSGILTQTLVGWAFATLAFWGLVASWLYAWTAWPILVDPRRAHWPARDRLRLAALLVLAHPVRIGAMGIFLLALLVASSVAIVAILTVSVAIAALVSARYVLPAADRLDARIRFAELRGLAGEAPDSDA